MKSNLDEYKLLPALKNCSNFLNELRVSQLTPKQYYEIYVMVFDSLEVLSGYLVSGDSQRNNNNKKKKRISSGNGESTNDNGSGKDDNDETVSSARTNAFLADLYEIVQYAGNIVPRLYMMIVVGTAYMTLPGAPTKDLMKDMIEMCHGVQHPIRGLFLRYYLSQRTKNSLPFDTRSDFNETVEFLITNFIEMNKLWVRLQHQGHSSEREIRYNERKELKILVGSNLVRLSQIIDDYDSKANAKAKGKEKIGPDGDSNEKEFSAIEFYQDKVFSTITEQIIQCRDHLAQTYLIDVLIQIFPNEFHFATLEKLLNQVFVNLHPLLNKSELVNTLIDKFITYDRFTSDSASEEDERGNGSEAKKSHIDVNSLFGTFWQFYLNLNESEPDLSLQEHAKLLESFIKLSLTFDPSSFKNLDVIYEYVAENLIGENGDENRDEDEQEQGKVLVQLLGESINHFTSIKTILTLNNYFNFFNKLDANLQKQIALVIIDRILNISEQQKNGEAGDEGGEFYSSVDEIDGIFKYMLVLIKQTPSTNLDTAQDLGITKTIRIKNGSQVVTLEFLEIQEKLNKLIHLIDNLQDPKSVIGNLFYLRKKYLSKNFQSLIFTYPTLIDRILFKLKLVGYVNLQKKRQQQKGKKKDTTVSDDEEEVNRFLVSNFKNLSVVIEEMYQIHGEYSPELILRKYLDIAMVSDQLKLNSITLEIFNQCFIIYEEHLIVLSQPYKFIDSRMGKGAGLSGGGGFSVALQSILSIANTLLRIRNLSRGDYEELIIKLTLYGSKLLKKQDGCRAIYSCAHLFWWNENLLPADEESPTVKEEEEREEKEEKEDKEKEGKKEDEETGDDSNKEFTPQLYRESKRVLECIQKSLRLADSIIDPYISLQLFIEILNQAMNFHTYGNELIDNKFISGLINLVRTNMDNLRENASAGGDRITKESNGNGDGNGDGEDEDVETRMFRHSQLFFNQTLQQINLYG
ncbi:vps35 [Candida metapsilosis]|uniref:Vacuolar protein sorting-associated protein 35 n=1 Tax=Candida metapsilosis TaxID=273372 RepID=A0A8H8DB42_9ASCO|nr:vps35 [Candida metapsilosis]